MTLFLISIGAFIGATARYLTDRAIQARYRRLFPWGTFAVNLAASLVLGGLLGAGRSVDPWLLDLIATGFCGALSTYSTFSFETLRLQQTGRTALAAAYVGASLAGGLAAAAAGWALGSALG